MTRDEFVEEIGAILQAEVGLDHLDVPLDQLPNLDSMALIGILALLDTIPHAQVGADELIEFGTLGALVGYLKDIGAITEEAG